MIATITPDLTMEELLEQYPGARRALFSAFHIGGCQSCAYQLHETLAEVCQNHQIKTTDALECLTKSRQNDQSMLISPGTLKSMITSEESFTLLDTRTREEFEAITLPKARLMTQELQNSIFADKSQETKKIILFDHQGRSILDHCAWFRGHGLEQTFGLDGGIDRYSKEVDAGIPRYRLELD